MPWVVVPRELVARRQADDLVVVDVRVERAGSGAGCRSDPVRAPAQDTHSLIWATVAAGSSETGVIVEVGDAGLARRRRSAPGRTTPGRRGWPPPATRWGRAPRPPSSCRRGRGPGSPRPPSRSRRRGRRRCRSSCPWRPCRRRRARRSAARSRAAPWSRGPRRWRPCRRRITCRGPGPPAAWRCRPRGRRPRPGAPSRGWKRSGIQPSAISAVCSTFFGAERGDPDRDGVALGPGQQLERLAEAGDGAVVLGERAGGTRRRPSAARA